jgi:N-acyl-D-amino-acid deacylase
MVVLLMPLAAFAQDADQSDDSFYPPVDTEDVQQAVTSRPATLSQLDGIVNDALQQYYVPGASLAVAHNGKLVYARGFGVANLRTQEPVTPATLFNLASCTKAVSMFGVLRLVDSGRLQLDTPFYQVIGRPNLVRGMQADPLVARITVRQLLHHSGGWNDDSGFVKAGNEVRALAPNGLPYSEAVRVLLATPLDYPPGTQAKYANGQWNLIKYVIECAAQQPYERFMQEQLAAIGIQDMCGETPGVTPGQANRYGGFPPHIIQGGQRAVPLMPNFGNWMASSVDMVKLLTALDGSRVQGISSDSYRQMIAELPPPMQNDPNGSHFGLGMDSVRMTPQGVMFTKNGGKPGVHCQIMHLPNNTDFCLMFNGGSSPDGGPANPLPPTLKAIKAVLNNIKDWPAVDMFQ